MTLVNPETGAAAASSGSFSTSSQPMPLEKVCELVCAHAELQSEHERLKKKVKQLNSEIEEITIKRQREVSNRIESIQLTMDRHIAALSLNCDETMRRKSREVDDVMLQMRRDMFDRISAAIASAPPPEVRRMRTVASQVQAVGNTSKGVGTDAATTPIARRIHALSELVSMSNDSSMTSASGADASTGSASGLGATVAPAPMHTTTSALHQAPRLYQPQSSTAPGAASTSSSMMMMGAGGVGGGIGDSFSSQQQPQQAQFAAGSMTPPVTQFHQQPQQRQPGVRFDMTPGLNMSGPPVSSVTPGTTQHEGELHTFLW